MPVPINKTLYEKVKNEAKKNLLVILVYMLIHGL